MLVAINAKYIHSNLAVYCLRAAAESRGISVDLAEFTINHYTDFILQELYKRRPGVLFFSCYIWNWEYVKELAAECRKIMPETPVWVGGPEVSYDGARVLEENPAITGVLLGEGEESFPRLLEYYLREKQEKTGQAKDRTQKEIGVCGDAGEIPRLGEIPGLAFRGERIYLRPQEKPIDINKLPFPYKDLGEFSNKIIYYESSRGCPFACSYCLSALERPVRFRDLNLVKGELTAFLEAKVAQVKFVDRTFNCRESHALEIWQFLLEHDNGVTNFHFEIGADLLTEKELAVLGRMRPGLVQLEIGVQSTHEKTLEEIHRRMDFNMVKKRVDQVKGFANIHQHLDLIAGLPFESLERFACSFDQVFCLAPEQLQLGFLKILKGSPMEKQARDYGILYREKPPYEVLSTPWLSYKDLLELKGVEQMVEIYYNSHQFALTLAGLLPFWDSAFSFFRDLARFYEEKGWHEMQHARVRRYEILLEFIRERLKREKKEQEEPRFRELLTFDYYLREHAKSRPGFAPDVTPWREEIRQIQKAMGREVHVEPGLYMGKAFWVFDYQNRNPLTKAAALHPLSAPGK